MNREEMLEKARHSMTPFETENLIAFLKNLSMKTILDNPVVSGILALVLVYALLKHSKFLLLFLFTLLTLTLLVRYTLPPPGTDLTVSNSLPFAFGSMGVGAVLLYFIFIKSE
ncbi:MAG TPA: hypothetical protein VNX25_09835 [Verrucomicrobiae bacterium]|nr:hypothetical protein [Verrucomicrobiae bacterium]